MTEILPPYDLRTAVRHLKRADPVLSALITRVGSCRLRMRFFAHPFEALLRAIVHQQLSGQAAATIYGRLTGLFPPAVGISPSAVVALPDRVLRGAGLSRNKVLAVKDLAAKTLEGIVPEQGDLDGLSDEEIIGRLTSVRGVGRWSVEMLLIFTLGRPDVLPVDDLGVRKGFRAAYGMKRMPAHSTMMRAAKCWKPYRSVASWYLWRAADMSN